jgi:hypothetical protein
MPAVPPVKALYSTHVQFRSIGWLRAALLYWEGILRFAPDRFSSFDPPEVHELVAAGLIENVSPERYRKPAADAFSARLDELLASSRRQPCLGTADPLIHVSQIDRDLLQTLQRRGLAASSGDWAKMSPDMAALYKATLANTAGRELNAAPTTDDTSCEAPAYFELRKLAQGSAPPAPPDGFACARVLQPFPSIEAATSLTAENLKKIRKNSSAQRRMFRETVQDRVLQIAELPSEEAVISHLQDFKREIEAEVDSQRGALLVSSLRDAWRLLLISAPASIGTAIAVAQSIPLLAAAGVVGSFGLGIADFWTRATQRKRAGHYLLLLDAAFGARRLTFGGRESRSAQNGSAAGRTSIS